VEDNKLAVADYKIAEGKPNKAPDKNQKVDRLENVFPTNKLLFPVSMSSLAAQRTQQPTQSPKRRTGRKPRGQFLVSSNISLE
jgi:hypothetical protein